MADNETTTGRGNASKGPAKGAPAGTPKQNLGAMSSDRDNSAPEDAYIVEETITKRHATVPPKAGGGGTQTPPPPKTPVPPPPPLESPKPKPVPPAPAPVAKPKPVPAPPIPATPPPPPKAPATAPAEKTPPPSLVPNPMSPKGEEELKSNIAALLKDVKIPERRDPSEAGGKKTYEVKQFDTALGAKPAEGKPSAAQDKASVTPVGAVMTVPHAEEGAAAPAPKSTDNLASIHTLKDDLKRVVHDDKVSYVHAVSLEEERRHRNKKDAPKTEGQAQRSKRVFTILFGVGVLVFLGASALMGIYAIQWARLSPPPTTSSSILFSENSVLFPVDGQSPTSIKQTLAQARLSSNATLGSITRIIPTVPAEAGGAAQADGSIAQRPATFAEFMRAIGAHPPEDLLRALSGDFFFGIHIVDKNAPVLIVPVLSYQRAFAGMLAWEGALNSDFAPAFQPLTLQTTGNAGGPALRTFGDFVMRNYDTRVLRDDSGQIQMYYSFPTQDILVIAESPYSFNEILGRLQAERRL